MPFTSLCFGIKTFLSLPFSLFLSVSVCDRHVNKIHIAYSSFIIDAFLEFFHQQMKQCANKSSSGIRMEELRCMAELLLCGIKLHLVVVFSLSFFGSVMVKWKNKKKLYMQRFWHVVHVWIVKTHGAGTKKKLSSLLFADEKKKENANIKLVVVYAIGTLQIVMSVADVNEMNKINGKCLPLWHLLIRFV